MSTSHEPVVGLTGAVIGAAIEVHRVLGPGLLESIYEDCLCHELGLIGVSFERQVAFPVRNKGCDLGSRHRIDLLVDRLVVVELKSVEGLLPIHQAQLLTELRVTGLPLGLLINFNVPVLRTGIKRMVNRPDFDLKRCGGAASSKPSP